MQKLVSEQKRAIVSAIDCYRQLGTKLWDCLAIPKSRIKQLSFINLLGSGSSLNASRIGQKFFESISRIPCRFYRPSEFMHVPIFPQQNSLYFFVSASGRSENALCALDYVNSFDFHSVAITNSPSSAMVINSDGFLLTHLPSDTRYPCIQSFTSQLAAQYWLANRFAVEKGLKSPQELEAVEDELVEVAKLLEKFVLDSEPKINDFCSNYALCKNFTFVGRSFSYPLALEASFQMKEYAPTFYSSAYPSGEFVRGPALQENKNNPIILFSTPGESIYSTLLEDAREIKLKNGHLISFAFEGQDELVALSNYVFKLPKVPAHLSPFLIAGLMNALVLRLAASYQHSAISAEKTPDLN
jgi:glutamine---fructose-6-phosphate transaminase (isomerizing)